MANETPIEVLATTEDLATKLEAHMKARDDDPVAFSLADQPGKLFLFAANYDFLPRIHAILLVQDENTSTPDDWIYVRGNTPYDDGDPNQPQWLENSDPDNPQWTGDPEILAIEAVEAVLEYRG